MVVDGETGLLVRPGDAVALREAIVRLLAEPGLRARLGEAGRRRVAQYHASAIVPRVERLYRQLLQGQASVLDVAVEPDRQTV